MNDKMRDPLLDGEASERVHYATGVLLDAADFIDEQTYHRGRLARALAQLHGAGTAAGLKCSYIKQNDPSQDELRVEPGLALDHLGRMIEVPRPACIRVGRWYESADASTSSFARGGGNFATSLAAPGLPERAVVADLFLRFVACPRGKTPSFAQGAFDNTNAVVPARVRDAYELRLVARFAEVDDPAKPPPSVPPDPLDLAAATIEERRAKLRAAIFAAWPGERAARLDTLRGEGFLPAALRPDVMSVPASERDPAWIFLARVLVAVDNDPNQQELGADGVKRPRRTREVIVDNDQRPFSITSAALARWAGI